MLVFWTAKEFDVIFFFHMYTILLTKGRTATYGVMVFQLAKTVDMINFASSVRIFSLLSA